VQNKLSHSSGNFLKKLTHFLTAADEDSAAGSVEMKVSAAAHLIANYTANKRSRKCQ